MRQVVPNMRVRVKAVWAVSHWMFEQRGALFRIHFCKMDIRTKTKIAVWIYFQAPQKVNHVLRVCDYRI
jgi:hypothetical protein